MDEGLGNDCELTQSTSERDLGVLVTEDLKWKEHIKKTK